MTMASRSPSAKVVNTVRNAKANVQIVIGRKLSRIVGSVNSEA